MIMVVAPLHQAFERLLDQKFSAGIHRGSSFIQDQDGGVFQERARYG